MKALSRLGELQEFTLGSTTPIVLSEVPTFHNLRKFCLTGMIYRNDSHPLPGMIDTLLASPRLSRLDLSLNLLVFRDVPLDSGLLDMVHQYDRKRQECNLPLLNWPTCILEKDNCRTVTMASQNIMGGTIYPNLPT